MNPKYAVVLSRQAEHFLEEIRGKIQMSSSQKAPASNSIPEETNKSSQKDTETEGGLFACSGVGALGFD